MVRPARCSAGSSDGSFRPDKLKIGEALHQIHKAELFKPANGGRHHAWKDYCEEVWGWTPGHANRLIQDYLSVKEGVQKCTLPLVLNQPLNWNQRFTGKICKAYSF